jgi:hypothetical protein
MEPLALEQIGILAYVALAMLLGAVIGLERVFADKPAGLRTHMLVAGARRRALRKCPHRRVRNSMGLLSQACRSPWMPKSPPAPL